MAPPALSPNHSQILLCSGSVKMLTLPIATNSFVRKSAMKKILLLIISFAMYSQAVAVERDVADEPKEPVNITNQTELSEYLYLRDKLSADFNPDQKLTHWILEALKIGGSAGFGLLANQGFQAYAEDRDRPGAERIQNSADGITALSAVLLYVLVFNNLPALQSAVSTTPHTNMLKNFIAKWPTHKPNIPARFRSAFDSLYDYYQKNGRAIVISEREAVRVVGYVLGQCEDYLNQMGNKEDHTGIEPTQGIVHLKDGSVPTQELVALTPEERAELKRYEFVKNALTKGYYHHEQMKQYMMQGAKLLASSISTFLVRAQTYHYMGQQQYSAKGVLFSTVAQTALVALLYKLLDRASYLKTRQDREPYLVALEHIVQNWERFKSRIPEKLMPTFAALRKNYEFNKTIGLTENQAEIVAANMLIKCTMMSDLQDNFKQRSN